MSDDYRIVCLCGVYVSTHLTEVQCRSKGKKTKIRIMILPLNMTTFSKNTSDKIGFIEALCACHVCQVSRVSRVRVIVTCFPRVCVTCVCSQTMIANDLTAESLFVWASFGTVLTAAAFSLTVETNNRQLRDRMDEQQDTDPLLHKQVRWRQRILCSWFFLGE